MTITPNEIINREFKKNFRGYDIDEVDEFLEQLSEDYEKLYKENLNLKEKIETLNEKLSHYVNLESTLQNTLLLAQSAADQAKESSKKEAELIIKNAQEAANELVKKAEERVLEINKEYEILKNEYNMFKSRFRALLQSELENLDKEYIINEK